MNDEDPLSDDQVQQLLEWDEALASGAMDPNQETPKVPSDLRLAKQIRCMQLLRRSRSKREPADIATESEPIETLEPAAQESRLAESQGELNTVLASFLKDFAPQTFPVQLGKFELREEIGRGGYGVVFLAYDRAMAREVALKVPHPNVMVREDLLMRFRIEARAAGLLDHPNIVQVYDAGSIGHLSYIASAYCPGTSLHDWLIEHPNGATPRDAAGLVMCLAWATQHANERGVFHRDLKPANILLQPAAGSSQSAEGDHASRRARTVASTRQSSLASLIPKITDFGLAKLTDETLATTSGAVLGTPAYMAPEQASGQSRTSTSRVDVYSLGAILYQLLSGTVPFEGQSSWETLRRVINETPVAIRSLRPGVARDLETICLKCLEKDPQQRYVSAGQLAEDLQRFLNDEPILARSASTAEQLLRLYRRMPLASSLVLTLSVAVLVGFVTVSYLWKQSEARRVQIERALFETATANELANQQQLKSQRLLYLNSISLAERESEVNLSHARQELLSCDESLRDWEWDYLWKQCNQELLELSGHQQATRVCRFSPDGRYVASGSGSWGVPAAGEIVVRENYTGKVLWEFKQHIGQITGLAFHPTKNWMASSDQSWRTDERGRTIIWDLDNGEAIASLGLSGSTYDVRFHPNGEFLATAGADGRIRIFRTENWRLIKTISHHRRSVHEISFHPSGKLLASAGRDGRLGVFDTETWELVYEQDDLTDVRCVCFNPEGSLLACSTFTGHLLVWHTKGWQLLARRFSPTERIGSLEFCPDGDSLLVSTISGATQVWDAKSGQITKTIPGHYPSTLYATTSPEGDLIATCGSDAKLRIWSMPSNFEPKGFRVQDAYISDVVVIPNTSLVATGVTRNTSHVGLGDGDYAIRVIDRSLGKSVHLLKGHTSWTTKLDVSPNGRTLLSASLDGSVRCWNIETGQCQQVIVSQQGPLINAAYVTETLVVSAGENGTLQLWNLELCSLDKGELDRHEIVGHAPFVCMAACKSQGWVAAADESGRICLWDARHPNCRMIFEGHQGTVKCLTFNSDGRQLAAGGQNYEITIWDVPSMAAADSEAVPVLLTPRLTCKLPSREVQDMQFLPGGERLAYASTNFSGSASVRLIDTITGEEALHLIERDETANSLDFDPRNNELVLAANSHVVLHHSNLPSIEERWQIHAEDTRHWHSRQADLAERQHRAFKLSFHLSHLIDEESEKARHYFRRANAYAAQSQWQLAENDFLKYSELAGNPSESSFYLAMLCLAKGDQSGFHTACDQLIARLAGSQDAGDANTLAWTLSLTPERSQDLPLMIERVRFACEKTQFENIRHLSYNTQALVLYRGEQYEQALESLLKSVELKRDAACEADWIILALIHHALGNYTESKRWLQEARQSIENAVFLGNPPSKVYSRNWINRFQMQLLLLEAQQLHQESDSESRMPALQSASR